MIDAAVVAQHNTPHSCWIIISGQVYNVTDFLAKHPGGASIILKVAGKDATASYSKVHQPELVMTTLSQEKHIGPVDPATLQNLIVEADSSNQNLSVKSDHMPLSLCINLDDMEVAAKNVISKEAYTYISSAADSLQSLKDNLSQWSKIKFRPQVLRDVSRIDLSTTILGQKCRLPFFIAATGLVGLTHPEGELLLVQGASRRGVHYSPSTYASISHEKMMESLAEESGKAIGTNFEGKSCLFFQLYVNSNRQTTISTIQMAKKLGFKGLFVTVDTPCVGKREEHARLRAQEDLDSGIAALPPPVSSDEDVPSQPGVDHGGLSRSLNWDDLKWIREAWQGPIALKGIQTAGDAKKAMEMGIEAIYLSNHGGRQLHSAPSSLITLLEIRFACPEVLTRCEVYIDGGLKRGGDLIKALCLGARAVGIGRPFLYAIGAYGTDGLLKAIDILEKELETAMALLGARSINELSPKLVNTAILERDIMGCLNSLDSLLDRPRL